jgi:predicted permease
MTRADADAVLGDLKEEWARRGITHRRSTLSSLWFEWRAWLFVLTGCASLTARWIRRLSSEIYSAIRGLVNRGWRAPLTITLVAVGLAASGTLLAASDLLTFTRLPYADPDRLVVLQRRGGLIGVTDYLPPEDATFWRSQGDLFADFGAYDSDGSMFLSINGVSDEYPVVAVTPELLPMLGAHPLWGRSLILGDASRSPRPVVISEDLAQTLYGEPERAVGQPLTDESRSLVVVGVTARDFRFPTAAARVWTAMDLSTRGISNVRTVARLPPNVQLKTVDTEARARRGRRPAPSSPFMPGAVGRQGGPTDVAVVSLRTALGDGRADVLFALLLSAAVMVLVIACLNIASFELGESALRMRDYAVQLALGATKGTLVRVGLLQGALLVGASGLLALLFTFLATEVVTNWLSVGLTPGLSRASGLSPRTVLFMCGATAVSWLVSFGVIVFRASNSSVGELLRNDQRVATVPRAVVRFRHVLAMVQIAGSVSLLMVATSSIAAYRTYVRLERGFDSDLLAGVDLNPGPISPQQSADLSSEVLSQLQRLPGVLTVAKAAMLPPDSYAGAHGTLYIGGRPIGRMKLALNKVGSTYFDTLRLPLRAGHAPTALDPRNAVVVDEEFAARYWPGMNPVGQRFAVGQELEIVGVAAHVLLDASATTSGDPQFAVYQTLAPDSPGLRFVMRVDGPSRLHAVTQLLSVVAPRARAHVTWIEDRYSGLYGDARVAMSVISAFGILAFVIAVWGVCSLVAFLVAGRTREIAVRLALGASPSDVRALVLAYPLRLAALGIPAGLAVAYGLIRLGEARVSRLIHLDLTWTVVVAIGAMVAILLTSLQPARRASRVNPSRFLRDG